MGPPFPFFRACFRLGKLTHPVYQVLTRVRCTLDTLHRCRCRLALQCGHSRERSRCLALRATVAPPQVLLAEAAAAAVLAEPALPPVLADADAAAVHALAAPPPVLAHAAAAAVLAVVAMPPVLADAAAAAVLALGAHPPVLADAAAAALLALAAHPPVLADAAAAAVLALGAPPPVLALLVSHHFRFASAVLGDN